MPRKLFGCCVLLGIIASEALVRAEEETCPEKGGGRDEEAYAATGLPFFDGAISMKNLPGFTRSVYERDHAVIAPESRVYAPLPGWTNSTAAQVVTPAMAGKPHFVMSLVSMGQGAVSGDPRGGQGVERFVFVLTGSVFVVKSQKSGSMTLRAGGFAYFPPASDDRMETGKCKGATLIMYERIYVPSTGQASASPPQFQSGNTDDLPVLPVSGEVFALRKLLPASEEYDFNIHVMNFQPDRKQVMDFQPGEYLNVKEMHYNQHGMLILQNAATLTPSAMLTRDLYQNLLGQGIQRLGDHWYPVQAGDAIWMAPMVPQWYAALGLSRTRYLLYKDTARDPLLAV